MKFLDIYFNETNDIAENQYLNYVYGIMFVSYITQSIKETKKHFLIKESKYLNMSCITDELDLASNTDNYDEISLHFEDIIEDTRLYNFINKLSDRQKFILYSYYINLNKDIEISAKLGITKQAVNKMRKKILLQAEEYKKGFYNI